MIPRFETTPIGPAPTWNDPVSPARLVRIAPALRPAFLAYHTAQSRLEQLFTPGTLCITTGQQPGLLTGALLSIHKALSAVAMARTAQAALGRAVVPVFWVAGDDHDFAEANHLHLTTSANAVLKVVLRERDPAAPLTPLYREPVGPEIEAVIDALKANTGESEFRAGVLDWLLRHYRPERDLATAFAGALAELLGPTGLVVFQSTHAAAKRAMTPWLLRALEQAAEIQQALIRGARALDDQGRPVPVTVGDDASLVMLEGRLGRDRLMIERDGFVSRRSAERWSWDQIRQLADEAPERFSPNVLLRPVIEAALLPTVAYAAGPGELAYFPQTEPVYRALEVEPQRAAPRWSSRMVESRIDRILGKYGIAIERLSQPEGRLEAEVVAQDLPPQAHDALTALRETLGREYGRLGEAAIRIDPTLQKPVESARNTALAGITEVEKRIFTLLKKKNEITTSQIGRARVELFPLGRPQERVLNIAPFLSRYGPELIDAGLAAATAWASGLEPPSTTP